jgi:hypothetical protein
VTCEKSTKSSLADRLAGTYGAIKRSMWYPFSLMLLTAIWWLGNKLYGWDRDLVNLLAFLSIEATIATSLVQRDQAHQEELIMKQLKFIRDILASIRDQANK